ncbi:MAG: endolytic transglycosylase MltG [Chloroflexi bacterium]|nr:endolytic transglycosylase MltG [Chloroflexota bacterium]
MPITHQRRSKIRKPKSEIRTHKEPYSQKPGPFALLLRVVLLFVVVVGCATAVFVLYGQWRGVASGGVRLEGGNPNLSLSERLYLQTYLSLNAEGLQASAGSAVNPVNFTIASGETAAAIANNLAAANLLTDPTLFINYARFYGLDSRLAAGEFTLPPQLTVPELAVALTEAMGRDIELRFIEGLRAEEMANYLAVTRPAQIDPDEFLAIVRRERPFDLSRYPFLAGLPAAVSLEGFLFPDTYRVPLDADAAYLINLMLSTFGERVTPAMRQAYGAQGLSMLQAVTLASIVQREAVLAEERPLIAGVFLNRLAINMTLSADPTVQYALGYQPTSQTWWKVPLFFSDLEVDSPYNTYLYPGLPPGPIANPSLGSLQAVANPTPSGFYFFVVDCQSDTFGKHVFSITFEEHLAHAQKCQ